MRIIQISDLHHAQITFNPFRCLSKRLIGQFNHLCNRVSMFSPEQRKLLPGLFRELKADLILVGGDLSTTALSEEFEEAKAFLDGIGIPCLYIPGNHDYYTYESHREKHFYRYFTNETGEFSLLNDGVERHDLTGEWTLVALDTARATGISSSRGLFSPETEENLDTLLSQISPKRSILLWTHYPLFANEVPARTLDRCEELQNLTRRYPNICCYLHGHTHRHAIADLRPSGLPVILDSGCPIQKEHGFWNLLEITPNACKVNTYHYSENNWEKRREQDFLWEAR